MTDEELLKNIANIVNKSIGSHIEPIKTEQQIQGNEIKSIKTEQQIQGKTLKYMKTKINKIAKTVDIIGRTYDEDIVENTRRIDRIENHLDLPAFKVKH